MDTVDIESLFKIRIDQLWHNPDYQFIEFANRGYSVHKNTIIDGMLFIGINPSFKNNDVNQDSHFFCGKMAAKDYLQYYNKFEEIGLETGLPWSHIDLLFIRERNQNLVKSISETPEGNKFINSQLQISQEIIQLTHPKVIIVANAYAGDLFKKRMFNVEFDNSIGTYRINVDSHIDKCPVFFSGMFSGQRALDLGSYERLKWHIKYVLERT